MSHNYVSVEDPCISSSCSHICNILSADSYRCLCPVGYQLEDGDNHNCQNIDECEGESDDCDQECTDTEGSYKCWCRPGYKLVNDFKCKDIDECTNNDHDCEQICQNTIGSFLCSCRDNYRLGADRKHCVNYIECVSDNDHTCVESHMICVNDAGGYHCVCSSGFTHDGNICQDVDECASDDHDCDQVCHNTQGGFICSCEEGYEKTDRSCTGEYVLMIFCRKLHSLLNNNN